MLNNIDTNINTVNEKIDTIFYFVETLTYDEYMEMCQKGQIEMRTIVFAKQQRAIYKGGDMYCPMEDDTFLSILLRMFDEEDVINALINFIKNHRGDLPIATKELLGVIMVGTTLAITEQGVLDVDFDNSDVINKIKNIIKNWFEYPDQNLPKASKEKFGIVKIGDGIKVQDGLISVDLGNPNGPDEDGSLINQIIKAVYNWFQENSSTAHAGYTRYGVVKIKQNSGIKVEDGVIEIDPSTMPSSLDQSIVSMTATRIGDQHNIVVRQNNNSNSPLSVDITSLVQNIIDNTGGGSGSGDSSKIKIRINSTNFHWEVSYDNGVTWEDLGVVAKGQDGRDGQDGQDGKDGKDGQDGSSGTNSTEIINIIKTSDDLIDELLKRIKALELAQQTGSTIQINNAITEIIKAINENNWNEIFHSSGWSNAMLAYLQDVGIITQWTDENGVITTTLNTTSILQNTNFINAVASQVETQSSPDGVLLRIEALESELEIGIAGRLAYATLKAALSDWDTSKPTIKSALSTTTNRVENTENGLMAIAGQSASVISDYAFTVALLGLNADPTGSLADLVSSFGQYVYTTDENGNEVPVYEVDNNGNALYQVDSEGHMLPYTGFLLKYLDANGNVTNTPTVQCTTKKIRLDGNNNPVLDSEGNPIYDDVPVYEKDGVTPIYRQVAIKVWYTGDYSGDYTGTDNYITSDDIYFNSDGSTQWEYYGTQNEQAIYKIKQKSGSMIAYHKVRKMRISSAAGFVTSSTLNDAVATEFARHNTFDATNYYDRSATETLIANNKEAAITSIAKMSIYEIETSNGKPVLDSNGDIKFKWHKDGETDVYGAASPYPNDAGWLKVIKSENQSGLVQLVTKDTAFAGLLTTVGEHTAFIEAIADKNGSTVTIKGDKINFNTDAINAIKANLTVDKLQAGTTNVVKVNGDDGVAIFTGGVNNSPTTWLKPDGSGYIAKGSIAWDNNTLTSNDSVKMTMYTDGIEVSGRASLSPVSKATITNQSIQIEPQGTQLGNTVTMNSSNGFKISGKSGTSIVGAGSINITGSSAGITMTGNSPSIKMNDETGFTGLISVGGRTLKFVGGILVSDTATS